MIENEEAADREILASCFERQLQPQSAIRCRAGIKTYDICAALDAMRRVREERRKLPVSDVMVEAAILAHANKVRVEYGLPPISLATLVAIEIQAKTWNSWKERMRAALEAAMGEMK